METRVAIEQAKGMLMGLHGISADRAFEVLVEQSQACSIRVAVIAAEGVELLTKQ
jgi:AmiR/NasT family two-component response regulator